MQHSLNTVVYTDYFTSGCVKKHRMAGQVCIKFVTKLPGTYQLFLTILMLNDTDISVYKG